METENHRKNRPLPVWKAAMLYSLPLWALFAAYAINEYGLESWPPTPIFDLPNWLLTAAYVVQIPGLVLSLMFVESSLGAAHDPNSIALCIFNSLFYYVLIYAVILLWRRVKYRRLGIPAVPVNWRKVKIGLSIVIILMAVLRLYQFRLNLSPMQVKYLPHQNPTSWVFKATPQRVNQVTNYGMNKERTRSKLFLGDLGLVAPLSHGRMDTVTFSIVTALKTDSGSSTLGVSANNQDDLYATGSQSITSRTYFALGEPLPYQADYHIHLDRVGSDSTLVSVSAVNPRVIKGNRGSLFGVRGPKFIPVEPTTIEEYCILLYMADLLGDTTMPALVLPAD